MKIDLCRLFGVEEGEEFKVEYEDHISDVKYRIMNNLMEWSEIGTKYEGDYYPTCFSVNEINKVKNITKLPKKKQFSQDTLNFFKCIDKQYKWIAKDNNGDVCIYTNKPNKKRIYWSLDFVGVGCRAEIYGFDKSLFDQILWEDEEPVFIDNYVER